MEKQVANTCTEKSSRSSKKNLWATFELLYKILIQIIQLTISEKITQFVEVVFPGLKAVANCIVWNGETIAGLLEDEALVVIQFLLKGEN